MDKLDVDSTLTLGTIAFRVALLNKINDIIEELNGNSREILPTETSRTEGVTVRQSAGEKATRRAVKGSKSSPDSDPIQPPPPV